MPTHYPGDEATVRALNAYINLVRASDSVVRKLGANFEAAGLTTAQFAILEAIYHLGPMCQKTLAEKLLRSGGNITVVVDNLEKRGWARRKRQADDKRMVQIQLTPRGRALIARFFPKHAQDIANALSVLAPEEQDELRRICRKLGKRAEESRQEQPQKQSTEERPNEGIQDAADSTK
jgi:MarR family transcriptional regulator, 2-MHQ and catechol-resistance regulon repressor